MGYPSHPTWSRCHLIFSITREHKLMPISLAILTVRTCYLFSHSITARALVISCYLANVVSTIAFLASSFKGQHAPQLPPQFAGLNALRSGCLPPPTDGFWRVFLPSFIFHAVLYLFVIVRATNSMFSLKRTFLLNRVLREYVIESLSFNHWTTDFVFSGGILFLVAFGEVCLFYKR